MDFLASEFRMKSWDEWYKVTPKDITLMGGGSILATYGGNHVKAIMQIYPGTQFPCYSLNIKKEVGFQLNLQPMYKNLEFGKKRRDIVKFSTALRSS